MTSEPSLHDPVELARARQVELTPPLAWSRFMAKLALACGRKAYGDAWMDSHYAHRLSADLLSEEPPKLAEQREHFPPLGENWPFLPPRHILWIDDVGDVAVLHVVLFGQLLGAVPINRAGARIRVLRLALRPAEARLQPLLLPGHLARDGGGSGDTHRAQRSECARWRHAVYVHRGWASGADGHTSTDGAR